MQAFARCRRCAAPGAKTYLSYFECPAAKQIRCPVDAYDWLRENMKHLIVFDMDGVLIDVSRSYRDTVRQTARLFLKGTQGWEDLPDPLFPLEDLARVKQSGGLNNDWDLTFTVLCLLFSRIKGATASDALDSWSTYKNAVSRCDVAELARFLHQTPMPVSTLLDETGRLETPFVSGFYKGDVGSGNIIKQIFQEIYLGPDLFEATYGFSPRACQKEGFIQRERLLIDTLVLDRLSRDHTLAIATGRPGAEADYPLDHFNIRQYFSMIYSLDDCLREEERVRLQEKKKVSLSKPHPYMLDAVATACENDFERCYYVGDMPDDMEAAARSKTGFIGIGTLMSSPDKKRLEMDLLAAGAVEIIPTFESLMEIVTRETG